MMVDVYMKDGRTTFRVSKRAALVLLLKRRVSDEHESVKCWVRRRPEESFVPSRLQFLNESSIAFVEQVSPEARQSFEENMGIGVALRPPSSKFVAVTS